MIINTGSFPKALWPGMRKFWGLNYKRNDPVWAKVFEVLTSTQNYEEDAETVGFGLVPVKEQSGSITYDTAQQGTVSRYTHTTYGMGFMVTMEEVQDNLYEKVGFKRASKLGRSMYETQEIDHAQVLNRAFSSSYAGGDGKELISLTHPSVSGDQSNKLTTAADISQAAIEDLAVQIDLATDSRGLKINIAPRRLIIPPQLRFEADRILNSVLQNDTANNAVNVVKNVFPEGTLMWKYLTDPDAWFIQTDCEDGLTHYTRMEPDFMQDNDFDTANLKAKVVARWSKGWSNFRGVYASEGA